MIISDKRLRIRAMFTHNISWWGLSTKMSIELRFEDLIWANRIMPACHVDHDIVKTAEVSERLLLTLICYLTCLLCDAVVALSTTYSRIQQTVKNIIIVSRIPLSKWGIAMGLYVGNVGYKHNLSGCHNLDKIFDTIPSCGID